MSRVEKNVKGIVLKQIDYKDNDVIINLLGEDGKLYGLYARGVKKITSKNANAILAFGYSQIEYFHNDKGLHTLKRAKSIKNYFSDFQDYNKIFVAFMLLDIVNDVMGLQIDDNPEMFKLLLASLNKIHKVNEYLLLAYFLVEVMLKQGIKLVVDHCAVCEKSKINYISVENGGFICENCLENNDENIYAIEILKLFRIINKIKLNDIEVLEFKENEYKKILKIIYAFYNSYTGLKVKNFKKLDLG